MRSYALTYELPEQYVHAWLLLGPLTLPAPVGFGMDQPLAVRSAALAAARDSQPLVACTPLLAEKYTDGQNDLFWRLEHTQADHRLERCITASAPIHARLWAASCLVSDAAQSVTLVVNAACPAAAWLNGRAVPFTPQVLPPPHDCLSEVQLEARLELVAGENHLILLLEDAGQGVLLLSAQVSVLPDERIDPLRIAVPVHSPEVDYWKKVEQLYESARLDRAVYSGGQVVTLCAPRVPDRQVRTNLRLQKISGEIYGEYLLPLCAEESFALVSAATLPPGEFVALLMPPPELYYEAQFRPNRAILFRIVDETPDLSGLDLAQRRTWVLQAAARKGGLFGLVAGLSLGNGGTAGDAVLQRVLDRVHALEPGCLLNYLGLWMLAKRAEQVPGFFTPDQEREINQTLDSFPCSAAPLQDVTDEGLFHAAQVLGSQRHPPSSATGADGREAHTAATSQAAAWLRDHAINGLLPGLYDPARMAVALVVLADYADSEPLADLAAVCLDQLLFWLASTHLNGLPDPVGSSLPAGALKSVQELPGAAINLLLWGQGALEPELAGAVSLASSPFYELPEIIQSIAADRPDAARTVWHGPNNAGVSGGGCRFTTYRTPDYRLSSFEHPESSGKHCTGLAWQAVLGPEAVVFGNNPGSFNQAALRPAGFWRGSLRPPVVHQWTSSLICCHDTSQPLPLGFTHTYFPLEAFDEARVEGQWAFARLGEAYVALYAAGGLSLTGDGDDAGRELRSTGAVWTCQLGRQAEDGNFAAFCASNRASPPEMNGQAVTWKTIRGTQLEVYPDGVSTVDGHSLDGVAPLVSPYATLDRTEGIMTIQYQGTGMAVNYD